MTSIVKTICNNNNKK